MPFLAEEAAEGCWVCSTPKMELYTNVFMPEHSIPSCVCGEKLGGSRIPPPMTVCVPNDACQVNFAPFPALWIQEVPMRSVSTSGIRL